jgi:hypothetical protein
VLDELLEVDELLDVDEVSLSLIEVGAGSIERSVVS